MPLLTARTCQKHAHAELISKESNANKQNNIPVSKYADALSGTSWKKINDGQCAYEEITYSPDNQENANKAFKEMLSHAS